MGIRGISGPVEGIIPPSVQSHLLDKNNPHETAEAAVRLMSGENVPPFSVVYTGTDGKSYIAKSNLELSMHKVTGISALGGLPGALVKSEYGGSITGGPWAFTPGQQVFFDTNGQLTTTMPTSGYIQSLGHAISATSVFLNLGPVVSPGGGFLSTIHFVFSNSSLINGANPWVVMQNKDYIYHQNVGTLRKAIVSCGSPDSGASPGSITVEGLTVAIPGVPEVENSEDFPDDITSQVVDNDVIDMTWNSGSNGDASDVELVLVIEHTGFLPIKPFMEN